MSNKWMAPNDYFEHIVVPTLQEYCDDKATLREAADMLNSSLRSVERARKVIDGAPPEVIAAVVQINPPNRTQQLRGSAKTRRQL